MPFLPWRKRKENPTPVPPTSCAGPPRPGQAVPCGVDLMPGVRAHVDAYDFKSETGDFTVPCWAYRTEGLLRFGQKELLFLIRRPDRPGGPIDPATPSEIPLAFCRTVARFASQGRTVDVGGITEFGPRGIFGRTDLRAIVYAPPHGADPALCGPRGHHDTLALLLLTAPELEAVKRFGMARVLALLGKAFRFYPYPLWNDLGRTSEVEPSWLDASIIAPLGAKGHVPGCAPVRIGGRIVLRIGRDGAAVLAEGLSNHGYIERGLLVPTTDGWGEAPHCMVWDPASRKPLAITRRRVTDGVYAPDSPEMGGEALLGCFIAFFPRANAGDAAIGLEDGFMILLAPHRVPELASALRGGRDFRIEGGTESVPFALEFRRESRAKGV